MISTILDQITKTFGTTYLISALTPWVVFWMAHAATCVALLGIDGGLLWYEQRVAPWGAPTVGAVVTVFLAVGALVLASLNGLFKSVLEGDYRFPPLLTLFSLLQDQKERSATSVRESREQHLNALASIRQLLDLPRRYGEAFDNRMGRAAVAANEEEAVRATISKWSNPPTIRELAISYDALAALYATRNPILLNNSHAEVLAAVRHAQHTALEKVSAVEAGRYDGLLSADRIRPTRFGNVLASVAGYAASRYGLDSIVFWSRLQKVVSADHRARIQDAKTLMDLMTTLTLCGIAYGVVWFVSVPFFTSDRTWQLVIPAVAFGIAWLFYAASVEAAASFAELVKSAFDLFRTNLARAYRLPAPATMAEERAQWQSLSRFVLYGQELDIAYDPDPPEEEAPPEDDVHQMD